MGSALQATFLHETHSKKYWNLSIAQATCMILAGLIILSQKEKVDNPVKFDFENDDSITEPPTERRNDAK
jgi:hypothetical protein